MKLSKELCDPEIDDGKLPRPFDIQSYSDLLQYPNIPASTIDTPSGERPVTEPLVDAIVVPTIRTAESLRSAVKLAALARCHLIAVYTDYPPDGLANFFDGLRPGQVTVLTVRSGVRDRLLDLGASLPQSRVPLAALDISRKRNLGLLIGRACGWTRILFLDDDIRKVNVAKLSSAAALLDDYPVVGLQVRKYPDASVVGHARRVTGRRQEPFISGGSLLVNPQMLDGYFAPVYHEDWLCVINHLRKNEVAIGGSVGQLPYLPFSTPERAQLEEFGDILLSGLLWLIHVRKKDALDQAHTPTDAEYWRGATNLLFWKQILEERAVLLQEINRHLTEKDLYTPSPLTSLAAARQRLSELEPAEFVSFMNWWLTSLTMWAERSSVLSRVDIADKAQAIEKALAMLGVGHVVRVHDLSPAHARTRETRWMDGFAAYCGRWIVDSRDWFGTRGRR